jgi:hypothetical protein
MDQVMAGILTAKRATGENVVEAKAAASAAAVRRRTNHEQLEAEGRSMCGWQQTA